MPRNRGCERTTSLPGCQRRAARLRRSKKGFGYAGSEYRYMTGASRVGLWRFTSLGRCAEGHRLHLMPFLLLC
jgi:hypothetical protein